MRCAVTVGKRCMSGSSIVYGRLFTPTVQIRGRFEIDVPIFRLLFDQLVNSNTLIRAVGKELHASADFIYLTYPAS